MGKCPSCETWSSFIEKENQKKEKRSSRKLTPVKLEDVKFEDLKNYKFSSQQLNDFFGKGLAQGSVILFAGEPGIGKSTFLLQLKNLLKDPVKILYVSGEETEYQVADRAKRLKVKDIYFVSTTCVEDLIDILEARDFDILIIDSIQTMVSNENESSAGSIPQTKAVAEKLVHITKSKNLTTFLVGHVTKGGAIAGPKILEHLVDVVVYMEGERTSPIRLLKCLKNRFGSTGNVVVLEMEHSGFKEIDNPSKFFVSERRANIPGSSVSTIVEGNKSFILEIQALVSPALHPTVARRIASMYDIKRLYLLLAIMEKRLSINLSAMDVYVNVPGGIFVKDTATDLAVVCSIYSSFIEKPLPSDVVITGEIGLGAEVRMIRDINVRVKEAETLGFNKILIPASNSINIKNNKIEIIKVGEVREAIEILFGE